MKKELNDIGVSHANLKSSHLPRLSFGDNELCYGVYDERGRDVCELYSKEFNL